MKHLKPFFENDRNRIMNFCAQAEDIINYENEPGEWEQDDSDILNAIRYIIKQFNMSEDDLREAIRDLKPHEVKFINIILDEIVKENERLLTAKYLLSKEDVMDIIQNYTDEVIPMDSLVVVLSKYKRES